MACDFQTDDTPKTGYQKYGKRSCDIGGAILGLLLLWPILLVLAILIACDSRGGIFYRQQRVGRGGKLFTLYKFRTMVSDAEKLQVTLAETNEAAGPFFKVKADPRITKVGHWLRIYSLDELPQLWNVLRGDMSLVGPRPSLASEVEQFETWMCQRYNARPGLSGLWQVTPHKNDLCLEEWIQLDLEYVEHMSLREDLSIIVRTVQVVFSHENE